MRRSQFGPVPPGLRIALLLLAAAAAAGCSAPSGDDRTRLGRVSGFVVDEFGIPIAGAQVVIVDRVPGARIGTRNYYLGRGPFVTNEGGQFIIPDVQVRADDQVVLNLSVTHPNYLSGYGSRVPSETRLFGGTRLASGVPTRDILVAESAVSDVLAVLPRLGTTTAVGASGADVSVPVTEVGGIPLATPLLVNVSIPPDALDRDVTVAVSPLTPRGVVSVAAALPATLPVTVGGIGTPAEGISVSEPGAIEFDAITSLSAVDVSLRSGAVTVDDYFFAPGKEPTVSLPVPFDLPVGTLVPILRFSEGAGGRARQGTLPSGEVGLGVWTLVGHGLARMGRTVDFTIQRPGTYAAVVAIHWWLGARSASGQEMDFNPLREFVETGYLATNLDCHLSFTDLDTTVYPRELTFLQGALAAVTGQITEGRFPVFVPPGTTVGVHCTAVQRAVRANLRLTAGGTGIWHYGTWRFWLASLQQLPLLEEVPAHLQGHVQGGGIEL